MRILSASGQAMEVRLANEASTVKDILDVVSTEWTIPTDHHYLVFRGQRLSPDQTLKEVGITDADELLLRGKLRGGCGAGCNMCHGRMGAGCRCDIM